MKTFHLSILFLIQFLSSNAQTFEGEWRGKFDYDQQNFSPHQLISLKFTINPDSTYTVFSYTKIRGWTKLDSTIVCRVAGAFTKDSLYLEEVEQVSPQKRRSNFFQLMRLRIVQKKNQVVLQGSWESKPESCDLSGTIYFWKKTNKNEEGIW
jgi:hypothetical protein